MGALYRDLVRKHSKARGSARSVLNILANYADDNGLAWPGRAQIASEAGMSERNVIRCIQRLCDEGRLSIEENAHGGRGNKPKYRIWLPEIGQPAPNRQGQDAVKGDNLTPNTVTTCHPLDAERVTNVQEKGDKLSEKGDKCADTYKEDNHIEPYGEPNKEIAADAASLSLNGKEPASKKTKAARRRTKAKDPPNAEAAPQRAPPEWQEFIGALCWVCHGHKEVRLLTKEQSGALLSEGKVIFQEGFTKDDLREYYKQVWGHGWQYKKDKTARPKPAQVRSSIAQLRAATPEGFDTYGLSPRPDDAALKEAQEWARRNYGDQALNGNAT